MCQKKMSMGSDTGWVGKKPLRRIGGMCDALSIASDLGFSVSPPRAQVKFHAFSLYVCKYRFSFTIFLILDDIQLDKVCF